MSEITEENITNAIDILDSLDIAGKLIERPTMLDNTFAQLILFPGKSPIWVDLDFEVERQSKEAA